MAPPCAAFGVTPPGGQCWRTGRAGSTALWCNALRCSGGTLGFEERVRDWVLG